MIVRHFNVQQLIDNPERLRPACDGQWLELDRSTTDPAVALAVTLPSGALKVLTPGERIPLEAGHHIVGLSALSLAKSADAVTLLELSREQAIARGGGFASAAASGGASCCEVLHRGEFAFELAAQGSAGDTRLLFDPVNLPVFPANVPISLRGALRGGTATNQAVAAFPVELQLRAVMNEGAYSQADVQTVLFPGLDGETRFLLPIPSASGWAVYVENADGAACPLAAADLEVVIGHYAPYVQTRYVVADTVAHKNSFAHYSATLLRDSTARVRAWNNEGVGGQNLTFNLYSYVPIQQGGPSAKILLATAAAVAPQTDNAQTTTHTGHVVGFANFVNNPTMGGGFEIHMGHN